MSIEEAASCATALASVIARLRLSGLEIDLSNARSEGSRPVENRTLHSS